MLSWNLYLGSFLSLPVFANGLGWLWLILGCPPSVAWQWRLFPGSLSGTCRFALVGLQCLWVPWSCGVPGLHDGVTCLRSGLCSSSVRDRDVTFPSFGGFAYWPSCGVPCFRLLLCASACVGPGGLSVHPRSSPPQILGPTLWNRLTFPLCLPVAPLIHSWFQVSLVAPIYWTSLALCCMALSFNVVFCSPGSCHLVV